jgi:hypothetical protein
MQFGILSRYFRAWPERGIIQLFHFGNLKESRSGALVAVSCAINGAAPQEARLLGFPGLVCLFKGSLHVPFLQHYSSFFLPFATNTLFSFFYF